MRFLWGKTRKPPGKNIIKHYEGFVGSASCSRSSGDYQPHHQPNHQIISASDHQQPWRRWQSSWIWWASASATPSAHCQCSLQSSSWCSSASSSCRFMRPWFPSVRQWAASVRSWVHKKTICLTCWNIVSNVNNVNPRLINPWAV